MTQWSLQSFYFLHSHMHAHLTFMVNLEMKGKKTQLRKLFNTTSAKKKK